MLPTDKNALADLIRKVVMETINVTNCPVKKIPVPCLDVTEEHRMDTGNPADKVFLFGRSAPPGLRFDGDGRDHLPLDAEL